MPATHSPDPRAGFEEEVARLAQRLLSKPLLPMSQQAAAVRSGGAVLPPSCHCTFKTCGWEGDSEQSLKQHLQASHKSDLSAAADCLRPSGPRGEMLYACYAAAISVKCQAEAPFACASTDRRCLRECHAALGDPELCTLVCFVCARRFAYTGGTGNAEIAWRRLGGGLGKVLGRSAEELERLLGLETYSKRCVAEPRSGRSSAWHAGIPASMPRLVTCEATPVDVLCCPEDIRCQVCACDGHDLCERCEAPLRTYCFSPIAVSTGASRSRRCRTTS